MNAVQPRRGRLIVLGAALMLASVAGLPASTVAAPLPNDMYATLELSRGDVDLELEPGLLQFFDEENTPFALQVIDGCAINDHYWIFAAGLAAEAAPLTVVDRLSGQSQRIVIPAYEPGKPIPTVLDPKALQLCRHVETGGLPTLTGVATYTSAVPRCLDSSDSIQLLSGGDDHAYRTFIRNGFDEGRVIRDKPISIVDESSDFDEIHLLAEGRTPRTVEGVVISGVQGMLPSRSSLDKALRSVTNSRIRRAFETAKNGRVPKSILADLGVKDVECVHHISLEMETLGAAAYLAEAGWIKEGGRPLELPEPVEDRFVVALTHADGRSIPLALIGPLVGSEEAGQLWYYANDDVKAVIADACALSDSFWTVAATETEEPVELVVTDTLTAVSASYLMWTDRPEPAWVADTESLPICG